MHGIRVCIAALLAFHVLSVSSQEQDSVLLRYEDIDVTFAEAFEYSLRHTNPDAYEASMSQPLAVVRVVENLYVLKRVQAIESGMGLISNQARELQLAEQQSRNALRRYMDYHLERRLQAVDWEGLAKLEYARNREKFRTQEEVRVEHVLVSIEDRDFEDFVERVRRVAAEIAEGKTFSTIALQYSDDPTVDDNQGDLGYYTRQRLQPTFAEAAFSMTEPGSILGPIMTVYGAHFIRFIDRKEAEEIPFSKAKKNLMRDLKKPTEEKIRNELLDEYKQEIASQLAQLDQQALLKRMLEAKSSLP